MTLTALGPSFIKAGQVLASRPDIVREDYMNELCILQASRNCLHAHAAHARRIEGSTTHLPQQEGSACMCRTQAC